MVSPAVSSRTTTTTTATPSAPATTQSSGEPRPCRVAAVRRATSPKYLAGPWFERSTTPRVAAHGRHPPSGARVAGFGALRRDGQGLAVDPALERRDERPHHPQPAAGRRVDRRDVDLADERGSISAGRLHPVRVEHPHG